MFLNAVSDLYSCTQQGVEEPPLTANHSLLYAHAQTVKMLAEGEARVFRAITHGCCAAIPHCLGG